MNDNRCQSSQDSATEMRILHVLLAVPMESLGEPEGCKNMRFEAMGSVSIHGLHPNE